MNTYNPFTIEGKTIFVTGASSGIGKAIAIECSKMGAKLIITGRNTERLIDVYNQLEGKDHLMHCADLSNDLEVFELVSIIPKVDGIVHCAGISGHKLFEYCDINYINSMFEINTISTFKITKLILNKKLLKSSGSIVFITSTSGVISSYLGGSIYSATKGALSGFIKGLALELSHKKIRVNSVMPSMIETQIMSETVLTNEDFEADKKKYPLKRYGKPEEVAFATIYLLSDASKWVTGTNLLIDGGRSINY